MSITALRVALLAALLLVTPAFALDRNALLDEANLLLLPRERPLPSLQLTDQNGRPFSTDALRGRWHMLFFGFTACPDICPTTLSDMRRLLGKMDPKVREQIQLVLVTADPARDSPEQLKSYLSYYRAEFKGLTGELSELKALSQALGLPFVPASETEGDYSVSHSANIALIAPDGSLRGHIRAPFKLDGLALALPTLLTEQL
ncbi:SCO family protein [Stutzerimonas stutzeri]|uniref:SCO family protein n=1 Tax=Stutzerimonas sp. S1 TaxID=3030652 RepID=UPI0022256396|nr:SCO family protein [Stutzerimonas sp. S1]MCW3148236.1 SCO family protein [Stutzerimonas sp. S1]